MLSARLGLGCQLEVHAHHVKLGAPNHAEGALNLKRDSRWAFFGHLFEHDLIVWVSMSFDPSVYPSVRSFRPSVHNEVEAGDLVNSDPDRGR